MNEATDRLRSASSAVAQATEDALDEYGQRCLVCGVYVAISHEHADDCPVPDFVAAEKALGAALKRGATCG